MIKFIINHASFQINSINNLHLWSTFNGQFVSHLSSNNLASSCKLLILHLPSNIHTLLQVLKNLWCRLYNNFLLLQLHTYIYMYTHEFSFIYELAFLHICRTSKCSKPDSSQVYSSLELDLVILTYWLCKKPLPWI